MTPMQLNTALGSKVEIPAGTGWCWYQSLKGKKGGERCSEDFVKLCLKSIADQAVGISSWRSVSSASAGHMCWN